MNSNNKVTKLLYQMLRRQIDFAPFCAWQNARRSPPGKEKRREKKREGKRKTQFRESTQHPVFFLSIWRIAHISNRRGQRGEEKNSRGARAARHFSRDVLSSGCASVFSFLSLFFPRKLRPRIPTWNGGEKTKRGEEKRGGEKGGGRGT